MTRRVLTYGQSAILAEVESLDAVLALSAAARATQPQGVTDIVPAARTMTVIFDPHRLPIEAAHQWVVDLEPLLPSTAEADAVTLDVEYAGEDLEEVAWQLGISVAEVIREHTQSHWRVAFGGFSLGFGYLVTDHNRLTVTRRGGARTRVPAGSVALAGEFSGVYPREGPGGWQLIGTTDAVLWDENRTPPALLAPGAQVRFRQRASRTEAESNTEASPLVASSTHPDHEPSPLGKGRLCVINAGPLTLVEDVGRPGLASAGVSPSGALDRTSLRLGNRILGNPESAAALEVTAGGLVVSFEQRTWFAVTGAWGKLTLDGHPIEPDRAVQAEPGSTLSIGRATFGMRFYLAVRGGIAVETVLGSRSSDLLTGLGPAQIASGDVLRIGSEPRQPIPAVDTLTVPAPELGTVMIRVNPGPRVDWFTRDAVAYFYDEQWMVSNQSNRIGVRLNPAHPAASGETKLERTVTRELPSEAMVRGAIQVPPQGQPTVLLADHPVTGGYPVIAVVTDASLDTFAQLRPGQRITFRHARTTGGL